MAKAHHDSSRAASPISRRELLRYGAALAGAGVACTSDRDGDDGNAPLKFLQFYAPGGEVAAQEQWFIDMVAEWNASGRRQIELEYVPALEYMNGIKLAVSFASGQAPDLFLLSPGDFLRYYNGGALADLTPYISSEAREDFPASVVASRMVDGRLFAVPIEVEPMAIVYSIEAFEEAGLDDRDVPKTWDELIEIAGKLTSSKRFGVLFETIPGYYQNFTWYPFMWQGGGEIQAPDGTSAFESDATIQALRFWQDVVAKGVAPRQALGRGAADAPANLASGYCAMQNIGVWSVAQMAAAAPDFPYGVFRLPVPEGGKYVTVGGGWAFVANARSHNRDEAASFIAWALASMTDDSVGRLAHWCTVAKTNMPPRRSVLEAAHQAYDVGKMRTFSRDIYPGTRGEPRLPPAAYKIISDAIQATQLGGADPAAVAESASRQLDAFFAGYSGAPIL
jgi:multiple sugar transport system substrate-binding protein